MDLTVSSFFHYYMFEPTHAEKPAERVLAMITTIALGILSLGFAHLICYFTVFNRHFKVVDEPDDKQSAVDNLYKRIMDLDLEEIPSASSWEEFSDDEGVDDPFDEKVLQDALDAADHSPSEISESVHVRFQTPDGEVEGSVKIKDHKAVGEFPSCEGSLISSSADIGKREETERDIEDAVLKWGTRTTGRESRLVRYLSERKLKRTKSKKRLLRTKSEKRLKRTNSERMGKRRSKKGDMKRSFSLKNVFSALKPHHEDSD